MLSESSVGIGITRPSPARRRHRVAALELGIGELLYQFVEHLVRICVHLAQLIAIQLTDAAHEHQLASQDRPGLMGELLDQRRSIRLDLHRDGLLRDDLLDDHLPVGCPHPCLRLLGRFLIRLLRGTRKRTPAGLRSTAADVKHTITQALVAKHPMNRLMRHSAGSVSTHTESPGRP